MKMIADRRLLLAALLLGGCDPAQVITRDGAVFIDAGPDARAIECDENEDADGDGIADAFEGDADPDGDGVPARLDEDSDGDGIPDREEAGPNPCAPLFSDDDPLADFLDDDSDSDGLADRDERAAGTDTTRSDTDGDGIPDLVEVGAGTDPTDRASAIPSTDFFVVLPFMGAREERPLRFGTNIEIADVFFLVDMTGSMRQERTNLIEGLVDTIAPGIQAAIPNVQFGAGGLDDYPYSRIGGTRDLPFYLLREIAPFDQDRGSWSLSANSTTCPMGGTNDIGMIQGTPDGRPDILQALEGLPCHAGGDGQESYIPALFATATGQGLDWPASTGFPAGRVLPRTCPVIPDEVGMRRGYPCFRPGALPIVLLFGDFNFHNGPGGSNAYPFTAPTYDATVTALTGIGARVIGIFSNTNATLRTDYEAIARDTGTVDGSGQPLVFDINANGQGLDTTVVNAVADLVGGTPQDVSTRTENVAGNPDEFDATQFIKNITPIEGFGEGGAGTGYDTKDDTTFYGVIPGTQVQFGVDFWNDVRPPGPASEVFQARIIVVGNGVADLDSRNVYILVPVDGAVIII